MPLKIVRRKNTPHWQIRGSIGGRRIEKSTGTTDRARAEAMRIKLENEVLDRCTYGETGVATFARALNLYLDSGGESRFMGPLLDRFGSVRLADITPGAIRRAAREIYPDASNATRNRQVITPMRAVINYAAENEKICAHIRIKRFKEERPERRAVTVEWLDAVMAECSHLPHFQALLMFLPLTGARIGDACSLRWQDVALQKGFVTLPCTKPGETERIALAPQLLAVLANLPDRRDPVFRYKGRSSVYGTLQRACKRAGVDYYTPHEIGRHTFATWLLERGYSLKFVAEAGRWKSIRLVADVYGHLEQRHVDAAVVELGENWGSNTPPRNTNRAKTGA